MSQVLKFNAPLPPVSEVIFITQILHSKLRNYSCLPSVLQTISSKPASNPFYNCFPETQNPNNIVTLVCSSLKEKNNVFWEHLQQQGLFNHFTSHEFSRVLLRCQSDSSTALTFFKWVRNHLSLKPNAHNYCIMIHILVWSKNFKQAMKLLLELVELNGNRTKNVSVTLNVCKSLLSCSNKCNWDPVVFEMLIKAYLRKGMVVESFQAFTHMLKLDYAPSVITINCLLNGLSKIDCGEKCWDIFKEMQRIGLRPNACTFNILTYVLCMKGNVDKVNEFLERMEEQGFDPDIVTYNMLIDRYCKSGRLKDAVYLYDIMHRRAIIPDLITFTALINGLCKGSSVREAHQLFHLMVHRGLKPDVFSYNTLVNGYCKQGMMKEVLFMEGNPAKLIEFQDRMARMGFAPNKLTCKYVIDGMWKAMGMQRHEQLMERL